MLGMGWRVVCQIREVRGRGRMRCWCTAPAPGRAGDRRGRKRDDSNLSYKIKELGRGFSNASLAGPYVESVNQETSGPEGSYKKIGDS